MDIKSVFGIFLRPFGICGAKQNAAGMDSSSVHSGGFALDI